MNAPFGLPGTPLDPSDPINKGLVGWWPMWEGAGGKCLDISGQNNHGALVGNTKWMDRGLGNAGDSLKATTGASDVPPPATMAGWVWLNARVSGAGIICCAATGDGGFRAEQHGGDLVGITSAGTTADYSFANPGFSVPVERWTHLICVVNSATNATLYANGNFAGTATTPYSFAGWRSQFGGNVSWAPDSLNGRLRDLRVWSRELSAMEARRLYETPYCGLWTPDYTRYYVPAAGGGADVRNHIIPAYYRAA